MEAREQRSSLMDVQKHSLDLCPDVISPVGGRQLNTPPRKGLHTKMGSGPEKTYTANRTHARILCWTPSARPTSAHLSDRQLHASMRTTTVCSSLCETRVQGRLLAWTNRPCSRLLLDTFCPSPGVTFGCAEREKQVRTVRGPNFPERGLKRLELDPYCPLIFFCVKAEVIISVITIMTTIET